MSLNGNWQPVTRPVCENCRAWRRRTNGFGDCTRAYCGLEYERPDGTRHFVEFVRTGKYATCPEHEPAALLTTLEPTR